MCEKCIIESKHKNKCENKILDNWTHLEAIKNDKDYEQYYTSLQYYENTPLGGAKMITIDGENTDMTISEFIFHFVKPMLRAIGYSEKLINDYVEDDYGL